MSTNLYKTNADLTYEISNSLQDKNLKNFIEIISNVIIIEGLKYLDTEDLSEIPAERLIPHLTNLILRDRRQHGETLQNALVLQGLNMLIWLDKE